VRVLTVTAMYGRPYIYIDTINNDRIYVIYRALAGDRGSCPSDRSSDVCVWNQRYYFILALYWIIQYKRQIIIIFIISYIFIYVHSHNTSPHLPRVVIIIIIIIIIPVFINRFFVLFCYRDRLRSYCKRWITTIIRVSVTIALIR